jgi:hypothetical protein
MNTPQTTKNVNISMISSSRSHTECMYIMYAMCGKWRQLKLARGVVVVEQTSFQAVSCGLVPR